MKPSLAHDWDSEGTTMMIMIEDEYSMASTTYE